MEEDIINIEEAVKNNEEAKISFEKFKQKILNLEDEKKRIKEVEKRLKDSNYANIFETEIKNIKLKANEDAKLQEKFWLSTNASLIISSIKWIILSCIGIYFLHSLIYENILMTEKNKKDKYVFKINTTTQKILKILQNKDMNGSK